MVRLSHYCEFKVEHVFSNQSFFFNHRSITAMHCRCVLSCANITYFTSASVAVDRRFNAASKKENNTEGMSMHFLIKYFLKSDPFLLGL